MNAPPARKSSESAAAGGRIYDSVLHTVGHTPLVRVKRWSALHKLDAEVLAKLEFFNPLGSVKDRIALSMIDAAEKEGKITPGKTVIIEPTSGNTGLALAMVAAARGYKLILTMPESMSLERQKMLRFMGAELFLTKSEQGMKGAIDRANFLAREHKDSFIPAQFDNPANVQAHRDTTAEEIWNDTAGAVDILVAGVGTGGTITGVAEIIKKKKPGFKVYAVEPKDSAVLSGEDPGAHKIQGIGAGFVPSILKKELLDGIVKISNDQALDTAREVARIEGIPCGISSGATFAATLEIAKLPENKGKVIVTMVASFAERYVSTDLFRNLEKKT